MTDALDLLASRRSVPVPALGAPGPSEEELARLLTIASRVPDHGRLAPWRFIVLESEAGRAFNERLVALYRADHPEATEAQIAKERGRFVAPLAIAVVSRAAAHPKIPEWEQVLTAGAVCMNLVNAAHAMRWASAPTG